MVNEMEENLLKKCPYCAEDIKKEAIVCKHCGAESETDWYGNQEWSRSIDKEQQERDPLESEAWGYLIGSILGPFILFFIIWIWIFG